MKDEYKMTVRFDLTDARERNLAEFMQTLDVKKYHSRNQFVIDALAEYVAEIFRRLREHGYDESTMKLYVSGCGGCLIKNFYHGNLDRVKFIDDICAAAKGYEYLADVYLRAEAKNEGRV